MVGVGRKFCGVKKTRKRRSKLTRLQIETYKKLALTMARARKSFEELTLSGAMYVNPGRYADRALVPDSGGEIGNPPSTLSESEVVAWHYLVSIAPANVLGSCDRAHMECLAQLFAWKRAVGIEEFPAPAMARLDRMLGNLGMNPVERRKLAVNKGPKVANPFDDI